MPFVSYAQNYEDVMLWRALKHIEKGFYVDAGAQDPVLDSVTKAFYDRGWRGINIEPVRHWFDKLVSERPQDTNLNVAVSDRAGAVLLYEFATTGLSTISKRIADEHRRESGSQYYENFVPAVTLDEVLQRRPHAEIHFLKIDVEGSEQQALQGITLDHDRPWIVLVEATKPNSPQPDYERWDHLLTDRGYTYEYFDGLNRFYLAHERPELAGAFTTPPNVFDDFVSVRQWNAEVESSLLKARLQEAEAGRQEAEAGRQEAEAGRQEAEAGRQEAEAGRQEAEALVRAVRASTVYRILRKIGRWQQFTAVAERYPRDQK